VGKLEVIIILHNALELTLVLEAHNATFVLEVKFYNLVYSKIIKKYYEV
jgi:hypothetical protein